MEVTAICPACKHKFKVSAARIQKTGKPPKCEACGERTKISNQDLLKIKSDEPAEKRGLKCDGCGKRLPAGVKFCAACGIHVDVDPTDKLHSMNLSMDEIKKNRRVVAQWTVEFWRFFNPFRWF